MKNLEQIREAVFRGEYDNRLAKNVDGFINENHVYDENQTVKWNRDKVNAANTKVMDLRKIYDDETMRLGLLFNDDVIGALMQEDFIDERQANLIYDYCFNGEQEEALIYEIDTLLEFLKQFNGVQNVKD